MANAFSFVSFWMKKVFQLHEKESSELSYFLKYTKKSATDVERKESIFASIHKMKRMKRNDIKSTIAKEKQTEQLKSFTFFHSIKRNVALARLFDTDETQNRQLRQAHNLRRTQCIHAEK